MTKPGVTTRQVHADRLLNHPTDGAVHASTTNSVLFEFEKTQELVDVFQGKKVGHVYSRSSSGSVTALQNILTEMEGGIASVCFATGMAAISSTILSLFKAGDHIIVSQYLFGNTRSFMDTLADLGIELTFVDVTSIHDVIAAKRANTRAVYAETIANPVTQVSDARAIGKWCEENSLLFMVDNTMTPPPSFDAKAMKASLVMTSLTKYIAGHGNVLGGAIIDMGTFDWTGFDNIKPQYQVADASLWGITQIKKKGLRDMGATLSPQSAHLISVGLETLTLRMARSTENALKLATYLEGHDHIERVYYPGLANHPQHYIAREQLSSYGAILSFDLVPGIDPCEFLDQLKLVLSATHLGDTRSLALPVASTIFFENGQRERARMGITETMIRLSVGIEDIDDIVADFEQALSCLAQ
ncbi:MAG: cystathionine gamma-synthase family protein [Alteromonadaceae bacterium]|nr:cystathionine gamma-synthase family protein [Alteromonadaceae bacterium]